MLSGCALTDNFDERPMFLEVPEITFSSSDPIINESQDIKDVWAFANGELLGVFELPARIPVLGSGPMTITLFAGIRDSGQALVAKQYPFFERMEIELEFAPGEVVPINFETKYDDAVKFPIVDNFETNSLFSLDIDGDANSTLVLSEDTPYGDFCGSIAVTTSTTNFEQGTTTIYDTSVFGGSQVYLELDHRSDVPFIIAVAGYGNNQRVEQAVIGLFPSEDWSKLYLNMSAILNGGLYDSYQLFISGDGLGSTGTIYLDNVRLLHY